MGYFDELGFPTQANGDVGDSAQRVGWIDTINSCRKELLGIQKFSTPMDFYKCFRLLEFAPGLYIRHPKARGKQGLPEDFSRDQQTSIRKALILRRDGKSLWRMFKAHALRGFKYQNKDWGLALGDYLRGYILCSSYKNGIFLFMPLYLIAWMLCWVADLSCFVTMLNRIGLIPRWKHETKTFVGLSMDDVGDDLNHFLEHLVNMFVPTPISFLSRFFYRTFRPINFGNVEMNINNRIYGAISWYFRLQAKGNPDLAKMAEELCERYF